ncbi:hypothetical protein D9611_001289 [Ephemerocybe angulata]|uniref:Glycosyltransferase family 8 protein n=1 Tax=Ephemerocybe angulata TaxID=980116 RepID=A0A8H5CL43_9AGAR|nr:hypothetical protein D9611_001289 [Tulosesus angulatus]
MDTSSNAAEGYRFTESQDWFSHNVGHWRSLFSNVTTSSFTAGNGARVLEIGSWEGRSAVFLCTELLNLSRRRNVAEVDGANSTGSPNNLIERGNKGEIVCVDHFDLFGTKEGRERYERLRHNLELTGETFRIIPEFSFTALTKLLDEAVAADGLAAVGSEVMEQGFDWVYVDGSHRSDDTFLDGEMAWRLTRKGGLVIFDDYLWEVEPQTSILHPKRGIDAFLALHFGEYERLSAKKGVEGEGREYQVVLRKTVDMCLGYLLPVSATAASASVPSLPRREGLPGAFEYGVNVGVTADSAFAMPLSVLLTSLLDHTPGRISIYLLDCGLTALDRERLHLTVSHRADTVTLNIIPLDAAGSLTTELGGPVWAKIDLACLAPLERMLYLDADTLVRRDVRPLWNTDLEGCAVGAALDVGHPLGHSGIPANGGKYFNAGVLLMDLAKMRLGGGMDSLKDRCREMMGSGYADQDALNVHFAGEWKEINLKWNAQGLGTYAQSDGAGRHWVDKGALVDPGIVHFTGPVHPALNIVLNPWVQPYTAKPWGYAGAPGHPFAEEWFGLLRRTAYLGYFEGEWREVCDGARERMVVEAGEKFDAAIARALGE